MRQPDGYFDPVKGTMMSVECLHVSQAMFPEEFTAEYGGHTVPVYIDPPTPGPTDELIWDIMKAVATCGNRGGDAVSAHDAHKQAEEYARVFRQCQRERAVADAQPTGKTIAADDPRATITDPELRAELAALEAASDEVGARTEGTGDAP